VVTKSSDWLAVDDDALLEKLQLRKSLVLPGEPKPEVVVDVSSLVDPALETETKTVLDKAGLSQSRFKN
jgi:hypothetical protein